jgi:hypothetical protein
MASALQHPKSRRGQGKQEASELRDLELRIRAEELQVQRNHGHASRSPSHAVIALSGTQVLGELESDASVARRLRDIRSRAQEVPPPTQPCLLQLLM